MSVRGPARAEWPCLQSFWPAEPELSVVGHLPLPGLCLSRAPFGCRSSRGRGNGPGTVLRLCSGGVDALGPRPYSNGKSIHKTISQLASPTLCGRLTDGTCGIAHHV